ncbi:MAG: type II secretion system protein GspE, partial [Gammaproteobacteria bacterium]|nr:type II secretion system protein GspE [Gammaproteobacteria bacterium]
VPTGCEACSGLGYKSRTGIYEVIEVDEKLSTMIHDGDSEHHLELHARKATPGIRDDGMRRVLMGDTSLEEVLRVTMER